MLRGLKWGMVRLCSSKIARDMARSMKKRICQKTKICKKKFVKLRYVNFLIKSCSKNMGKALNQSISTFYGLHHEKGKSYTFEHFKKAAHKSRIYRIIWSEESRKKYQIWTWNLLSRCLKIWRKKFAKQMNLDLEASINS